MAIHDYPLALAPESIDWVSIKSSAQFKSPFDGTTESIEFPGERWGVSIAVQPFYAHQGGQAEAFFGRLAGGMERVRIYHFKRPVPKGSMRGAPTVASLASRGALAMQLATDGTLQAGDMFKVGGQLFQTFQDCAPVAGVLTVPLVQRVRGTIAVGAAVQWDKPSALFVMPSSTSRANYGMGQLNAIQVDLEEVYA